MFSGVRVVCSVPSHVLCDFSHLYWFPAQVILSGAQLVVLLSRMVLTEAFITP